MLCAQRNTQRFPVNGAKNIPNNETRLSGRGIQKNQEKHKVSARKSTYGITGEQYKNMLVSQNGVCAICAGSVRLSVDHCHITDVVRGILCCHCNRGLGGFHDSAEGLQKAILYLQKTALTSTGDHYTSLLKP